MTPGGGCFDILKRNELDDNTAASRVIDPPVETARMFTAPRIQQRDTKPLLLATRKSWSLRLVALLNLESSAAERTCI